MAMVSNLFRERWTTHFAGLGRGFPTIRLMTGPFRWIGKSRRRVWCVVVIMLSVATAPALWWSIQLTGLPDIGDPFDIEAFRAKTIPHERNAFVLYRQAAALFKPLNRFDTSPSLSVDLHTRWSTAAPEVRRWSEVNREALALYRRGAEKPDSLDSSLPSLGGYLQFDALRPFQRLALLEASRLEERGDMAGAWGWYRTYLRTIRHVGSYGTVYRRIYAQAWHDQLNERAAEWADDKRTTPEQLRLALADVVACEALVPSESHTIKLKYLDLDQMLDGRDASASRMPPPWLTRLGSWGAFRSLSLTPERRQSISDAWRFWRREPERSRRVVRLATANRLAFHDLPPDRRPKPDPEVSSCDLYSFGPESPAKSRVLSPKSLGRWLDSTHDAQVLMGWLNRIDFRFREVASHRRLVILLGTGLYRRDHGTDPPTPEALVGPYLKSLPVEFPDEGREEADSKATTRK